MQRSPNCQILPCIDIFFVDKDILSRRRLLRLSVDLMFIGSCIIVIVEE